MAESQWSPAVQQLAVLWPDLQTAQPAAVHAGRKLSRKIDAELIVADAPKKVRRAWRDLRRALAPLRDHDVTGEHIVAALRRSRVAASKIAAFTAQWEAERATMATALQLPADLACFEFRQAEPARGKASRKKRPNPVNLQKNARLELIRQGVDLLVRTPLVLSDPAELEAWHTLRKALKRYRHTIELIEEPADVVKQTLDAYGRLQDSEVVVDTLQAREQWAFGTADRLIASELTTRKQAQAQIVTLWPALSALISGYVLADELDA